MADRRKKEVIPRQSQTARPRQAETPTARWNVVSEDSVNKRVVLDAKDFRGADGKMNVQGMRDASKTYPGQRVEFLEKNDRGVSVMHRPRSAFYNENGVTSEGQKELWRHTKTPGGGSNVFFDLEGTDTWKASDTPAKPPTPSIKDQGLAAQQAERQRAFLERIDKGKSSTPTKSELAGKTSRSSTIAAHPDYRHVRVETSSDGKRRMLDSSGGVLRSKAAAQSHNAMMERRRLEKILSTASDAGAKRAAVSDMRALGKSLPKGKLRNDILETASAHDTRHLEAPSRSIGRPTEPAKKMRGGEDPSVKRYRKNMRLLPSEYVQLHDKTVRKTSIVRASRHRAIAAGREFKKEMAAFEAERKADLRAAKHAAAVQRDKIRRAAYDKSPTRKASRAIRGQKATAKKVAAFTGRLKNLTGFGKVPLKMLTRGAGLGGRMPGKKGAMAGMSRKQMYPAMNHATRRSTPAFIKGQLSGVTKGMSVGALYEGNTPSRIRGTKLMATQTTIATDRFPTGGSGVFFRINAAKVLANLEDRFPRAIQMAISAYSQKAGQQLLDIVEPYVPKDTGLLYSTAMATSSMSGGGLVDIDGAEAYPSSQMFGVSISYNAPYAEIVYFDTSKSHGAAYNAKHGAGLRGERETARWIEVAYADPANAGRLQGILIGYGMSINSALGAAGVK